MQNNLIESYTSSIAILANHQADTKVHGLANVPKIHQQFSQWFWWCILHLKHVTSLRCWILNLIFYCCKRQQG